MGKVSAVDRDPCPAWEAQFRDVVCSVSWRVSQVCYTFPADTMEETKTEKIGLQKTRMRNVVVFS